MDLVGCSELGLTYTVIYITLKHGHVLGVRYQCLTYTVIYITLKPQMVFKIRESSLLNANYFINFNSKKDSHQ